MANKKTITIFLLMMLMMIASVSAASTINDFGVSNTSVYYLTDINFYGNISSTDRVDFDIQYYNSTAWETLIILEGDNYVTSTGRTTPSYSLTHNGDADALDYAYPYVVSPGESLKFATGGNVSAFFDGTDNHYIQFSGSGLPTHEDPKSFKIVLDEVKVIDEIGFRLYSGSDFWPTDMAIFIGFNETGEYTLVENHTGIYSQQDNTVSVNNVTGDTVLFEIYDRADYSAGYYATFYEFTIEGGNISAPYDYLLEDYNLVDPFDTYGDYDLRLYTTDSIASDNVTITYENPWVINMSVPSVVNPGYPVNLTCNISNILNEIDSMFILTNHTSDGEEAIFSSYNGDILSETTTALFDLSLNVSDNMVYLDSITGSTQNGCTPGGQTVCSMLTNTDWSGSNTRYWYPTQPATVVYEFKEELAVEKLYITQHSDLYATALTVEVSDNGVDYEQVYYNGSTSYNHYAVFDEPAIGRYFKLSFANGSTGANAYIISAQFYVYDVIIGNNTYLYENNNYQFSEYGDGDYYMTCVVNDVEGNSYSDTTYFTETYKNPWDMSIEGPDIMYTGDEYEFTCNLENEAYGIEHSTLSTNYSIDGSETVLSSEVGNEYADDGNNFFTLSDSMEDELSLIASISSSYNDGCNPVGQPVCGILVNYDWIPESSSSEYWLATSSNQAQYAQYEFKEEVVVSNIFIKQHPTLYGTHLIIQTSDNGLDFTTVWEQTGLGAQTDATFDNKIKSRYWRIWFEDSSTEAHIYVMDLQFTTHDSYIGTNTYTHTADITLDNIAQGTFNFTCQGTAVNDGRGYNVSKLIEVRPKPILTNYYIYPDPAEVNEELFIYANFEDILPLENVKLTYNGRTYNGVYTGDGEEIYAIGDSIVAGGTFLTRLDAVMGTNTTATYENGTKIYNKGIGGNTCDQVRDRWNDDIPPNKKVIVLCGINGFSRPVEQVTGYMDEIYDLAQAQNNDIIWLTVGTAGAYMCPGDGCVEGLKEKILGVNDWLMNNLSLRDGVQVVDTYHAIWNGTDAYCADGLCNADGLHLSSAGGVVVGDLIHEDVFDMQSFGYYKFTITPEEEIPPTDLVLSLYAENEYIRSTVTTFTASFLNPLYEDAVGEGVSGVKVAAYAAFALIAVMIIAAIAMLIFASLSKGANFEQMITVVIWAIGAAIVLMVGYIIISAVAGGLV